MDEQPALVEGVYALARRLLDDDVTEGQIAEAGGMTRQSINARGLRRTTGQIGHLGFGLCVLRAGVKYGRPGEAIALLLDQPGFVMSSVLRAGILFPDVTTQELAAIEKTEESLGVSPLPDDLLRSILRTLRAPKL